MDIDVDNKQPESDAHAYLAPLFLGTAGENADAFERALLGVVREHIDWRRNFHPDGRPPCA